MSEETTEDWGIQSLAELDETARAIVEAPTDDFRLLSKRAGLDPQRDFRFTNWAGTDFSGCNLGKTDFTGANLTGCSFAGATIARARFDKALVDKFDLMAAKDWDKHVKGWKPPKQPVGDRHLPDGALFFDAPMVPAMVVIPAGRYLMGPSPEEISETDEESNQSRRQEIDIPYRFALARDPISEAEYAAVMPKPPRPKGTEASKTARTGVSWEDAQDYFKRLGKRAEISLRLPSEAEWEYACRAGTLTKYWWGDDWDASKATGDAELQTLAGHNPENQFGLRDMSGNVWEWVQDVFEADLSGVPADASPYLPKQTRDASLRVVRGGAWNSIPRNLRSANRSRVEPGLRINGIGFRPARTLFTPFPFTS